MLKISIDKQPLDQITCLWRVFKHYTYNESDCHKTDDKLFDIDGRKIYIFFIPTRYLLERGIDMESVYKVIEVIGTSPSSWEEAARNAVETAAKSLSDLRVAEIVEFDMRVEEGKVVAYRAKVKVSFKFKD